MSELDLLPPKEGMDSEESHKDESQ
jgi:hypothetical protein